MTDMEGREHEWRKREAIANAKHASKAVTGAPAYGQAHDRDMNDYSKMTVKETIRAAISAQTGGY